MASQSTTIQLRVDKRTKDQAQAILRKLGLDLSSATKLFLNQIIRTKSIPFVARTENGYTPEYEQMLLDEVKAMENGSGKRFKTVEDLMKDLNS
jgi:DNA-damage-inducible protein J